MKFKLEVYNMDNNIACREFFKSPPKIKVNGTAVTFQTDNKIKRTFLNIMYYEVTNLK